MPETKNYNDTQHKTCKNINIMYKYNFDDIGTSYINLQ